MTYDPYQNPEHRGVEYPPIESGNAYEYPAHSPLPPPLPPPVYQQPAYPPPYPTYPVGYPSPYQGYAADPYDPYGGRRPGTNGMAIGSLVTSVISILVCFVPSIVGLILGIVALNEIKRTGQDGHGMALAGVIIGAIGTGLLVLFVIFAIAGNAA